MIEIKLNKHRVEVAFQVYRLIVVGLPLPKLDGIENAT